MTIVKNPKHNTFFYGWPVLLVGSLITFAFTYYAYVNVVNENRIRYEYDSEDIIKLIEYRMNQYEEVLLQTRGFFLSSEEVTRTEFAKYVKNLEIERRHPEIQALGFGKRILKTEESVFLKKMQKDISDFSIWPRSYSEEFYPIIYIEPFDLTNQKALGYDSFSEEKRKAALTRSFQTGSPSLTGKIYLVQEDVRFPSPGLILYVPFMNKSTEYFYTAFRADTLFKSLFHHKDIPLSFEVFDGEVANNETLIYDQDNVLKINEAFSIEKDLYLYGKKFLIRFYPSSSAKLKSTYNAPCIVFIVGMIFSFLIFRLFGVTKKSQIELREALESRDEFISIASHELKTPITAIKLHTQLVKRNVPKFTDPEAVKKFHAEHIDHTEVLTRRLERLVDDMLDISRIKAGRLTVFKDLVDMNDIVSEVVARFKDQFKAIPGSTPDIHYGIHTSGIWDKHRIDQVVTNLLTNAIKYGEGKKIIITTVSTPTTVSVIVKDNGIGIAPEFHDKIFHRFERAGVNVRGISGLGLGLYITQQIVQMHSGVIKVESEPGKGSTFTLELPKTS